jgi:hypothetical protein
MKNRHPQRSSASAPSKVRIDLPNRLYSKAAWRASESGHPTLADYVVSLIESDVAAAEASNTALRRALDGRTRPPVVSRQSFRSIRKRLLDGMMSHMKASEDPGYGYTCGYRLKHIDRCVAIIDAFHSELFIKPNPTPQRITDSVHRAVLKLNKLNAACNGALIETDQREDLCQLLLVAARKAGLKITGDITEPWRNW